MQTSGGLPKFELKTRYPRNSPFQKPRTAGFRSSRGVRVHPSPSRLYGANFGLIWRSAGPQPPNAAFRPEMPVPTSVSGRGSKSWFPSADQLGSDSQTSSNPNRRKVVFLCVPPGQKQDLHVHVKSDPSNAIRLRLRWSPHLPYPVRLFIREQITADSKRLKSMRLSADTKAKPSTQ